MSNLSIVIAVRYPRSLIQTVVVLATFILGDCRSLHAQEAPGTITGRVIVSGSSMPVPFANVVIEGTRSGTSSGPDGAYTLRRVSVGKIRLKAGGVGFKNASKDITVEAGKTVTIDFELEEAPASEAEVVVSSDQPVSAVSSKQIQGADFALRPRLSTQDLLRMVPGLFIAQHAGGGKAEQIFIRGFDCDHGTDVNVSVDGVPVNMVSHGHGQGYADLHFTIPEVLQGMDVQKGPYFVQSGDFGTAGTVKFNTLDEVDQSSVRIESGFFGLVRLTGTGRLPFRSDATTGYVAGELLHNDSYFDNKQDFKRINLFGKVRTFFGEDQSLSVWASGFSSNWNASGQIPERAVAEGLIGRYGSIDPSEGGETFRHNLNIVYSENAGANKFISQAFASKYHFKLFSDFTFFKADFIHGDEIEQDDDRVLLGGRSEYTIGRLFGNPNLTTLLGGAIRTDGINNQLWHVERRVRVNAKANDDIRETSLALYLQQDVRLGESVRLQLGARDDYFIFDVNDLLPHWTLDDISGVVRQNIVSPKFDLIVTPERSLDLYLNAGSGFHSNDGRGVLASRGAETLPRALGAEFGARYTPGPRFSASASFWGLDLEHELTYSGDDGTTEEKGRTRRIGIDLGGRVQLLSWLWGDVDLTVSKGRFTDLPDGENFIPLAPDFTSTGGLTARRSDGLEGTFRYRHMSERPAIEDNSVRAHGYTVFDAGVGYSFQGVKLSLIAENLFNTEWNEAQFETESRLRSEPRPVDELDFTPGTPLAIRAMIQLNM